MKKLLSFFAFVCCAWCLPTPVVYYINIDSGPNSGGRNNNGTTACVVGAYFGSARGSSTVTIGGASVAEYISWGDYTVAGVTQSRACFSVGASVTGGPGNAIVTVGGVPSVATSRATFTVRSASIFYAGVTTDIGGSPGTASDSNTGAFNTPVATLLKCKNLVRVNAGSFCYVRGSVTQTGSDPLGFGGTNASTVYLNGNGTESAHLVLSGWPADATLPTVGDYSVTGFYNNDTNATPHDHWTITGFRVLARGTAFRFFFGQYDMRLTDNYMACPHGDGQSGCIHIGHTQNSPEQNMVLPFWNNEITNAGCGNGPTGGIDDSSTNSGQTLTFPCDASAVYTSTMSSSDGLTLTRAGGSSINTAAVSHGDHAFVATTTPGVYEDRIIDTVTTNTITVTVAFTTTTFTGAAWYTQPYISNKQYHTTYWTSDINGVDAGWNYIHNNSSNHGINYHSTTSSGGQVPLTSCSTASPSLCTLTSAFATGVPVNSQRIDIVLSSQINGSFFVGRIDDTHFTLYTDVGLTIPYSPASTSTGGYASRSGFGMFNFAAHDNWVTYQNGACYAGANEDASKGPITVYNNLFTFCGTGPWLEGGRPNNMGGMYMLNTPDSNTQQLWGSGTVEVYNNTWYNLGVYNAGDFMLGINMAKNSPGQFVNLRNNIFYQPSGLAFAAGTDGGNVENILGDTNIFFGTNSASIPPSTTSNVTANPMFVSFTDFHLQDASPARNTGLTISGLLFDILGLSRPQVSSAGSGFSMGAYEIATPPPVGDPTSVISTSTLGGNVVVH